ncbi:MAG: DUF3570 domain-containing protein [Methyloglobulus sp.]|nr:DUF3570 domain-containing protein [Methyloglobulus sp.]
MTDFNHKKSQQQIRIPTSLQTLTAAALVLPGLFHTPAKAAEDDSVDFQYSHYQEGKRDIYGQIQTPVPGVFGSSKLPQNLNPIEVDSLHGSSRVSLTDRVKFAFNYLQDTWSGATPIGTAPIVSYVNNPRYLKDSQGKNTVVSGASPLGKPGNDTGYGLFIDKNRNFYQAVYDPNEGIFVPGQKNNQLTHVLSYASPETRKQGDFKLSYDWDEASLSVGGGISIENDYESRFGNLGGRLDFNQKQTTVNWGVSYTNSDTVAIIDPDFLHFINTAAYDTSYCCFSDVDGQHPVSTTPLVTNAHIINTWDTIGNNKTNSTLYGNRQDWGITLGLTQVLNKNSLISADLGYTRSTGYLGNPYKGVYIFDVQPTGTQFNQASGSSSAFLEIRPDERNQFNWHLGYNHYIEPLDAALHFNYHFAHDDWGIQAHTFETDWVQPFGSGWTVTPRIRYYSQSAADFYTTGIFVDQFLFGQGNTIINLPQYYSSDQRLSGYGTLSGGVTVEKKFTKGVSLETGFEYYTHQGSLKIGGGGEKAFADFDYWVANAALKVNLGALNAGGGSHDGHNGHHHHHSNSPAGVMFDHTLPKAGDFMAGYRFMRSEQAGDMLSGSHPVSLDTTNLNGCVDKECAVTPDFMAMSMHMLDLMYAPTDWLTLMLMPQWMDMEMTMTANPNVQITSGHGAHAGHGHQSGGIGDFGAYALFKAFDHPNHHLTVSLGGTAPTGDVDITLRKTGTTPVDNVPIHYGMQLGSGTWDFKPALTYTGEMDNFLWGAQANATIRLEDSNESGFAFGDIFQGSVWGGYNWTNWLATTMRGVYTSQGRIHGAYPASTEIDPTTNEPFVPQHIGPFDFPGNYGGQFVDLGLGLNVTVPSGAFQGNTLKFEWLQPIHTDYNGYQLDRDYAVNFTWSYGF